MAVGGDVNIRLLRADAEIEALTDLLHRAYRELADMGLHFLATHQSVETTLERIRGAECFVATVGARLVGTLTFREPAHTSGHEWYDRPDVAAFNQFAVEPQWRRTGIGRRLIALAEARAAATGASELSLDTAAPAAHLIALYERWGYRVVGRARWTGVNYDSVIMSKRLPHCLKPGNDG